MAARPPSCLSLAARPRCRLHSLRTITDRASNRFFKLYTPAPSTSDPNGVKAAPEINLETFKPSPSRIVPASPSYFTTLPRFTDDLLRLQNLYRRYELLPTVPPIDARRRAWIKLNEYNAKLGETVQASKFNKISQLLARLNRIRPGLMPPEVTKLIKEYLSPGDPFALKPPPPVPDEDGKAKGVGRRKEASAKVFLVEGEGEVLVNGRSFLQAFPRLHDRESAIWPLKVTNRVDKYNVWALVTGGGTTGQAEALTLGLAKALMVHEPMLKPILRRAGCITRDRRRVERKKHGHLKARKMPAWVKR